MSLKKSSNKSIGTVSKFEKFASGKGTDFGMMSSFFHVNSDLEVPLSVLPHPLVEIWVLAFESVTLSSASVNLFDIWAGARN